MEEDTEKKTIEIDQETLAHLNTTRKWSGFLAIFGVIVLVLLILVGLIMGTFLSAFNTGVAGIDIPEIIIILGFIILTSVCIIPFYYLSRFSKHTSVAVRTFDKLELNKAMKNLKKFFIYIGFLIIISIIFYIVILMLSGSSVALLKDIT
jgi:hypothetical protein